MARSDPLIIAAPLDYLFFRGLRCRNASKTTSARRKSTARPRAAIALAARTWVQLAAAPAPPRPSFLQHLSRYPLVSLIGTTVDRRHVLS